MSAYETSHYMSPTGVEKVRMRLLDISDDVPGPREVAYSMDNGKTWPDVVKIPPPPEVEGGTLREWPCEYFVDPVTGRQLTIALEGVFPTASSDHGATAYYLKYSVADPGKRESAFEERVMQHGYTPDHPLPSIWIGHNAFTNAGRPSVLRMPDGRLLAVISTTVMGPHGKMYKPEGAWYWLEALVLHGFWRDDGRIDWHAGPVISTTTELSSRGLCEPALAIMPDGRVMCILRGCNGGNNDPQGELPAHKWLSYSSDGGATWSFPEPWQYDTGEAFMSPSSISQLLPAPNGKLYWLGNIADAKPYGDRPRDKLYIGEVDQQTMRLKRDSLFLVAAQQPGEPQTQLSNFLADFDRETGEMLLYLPWFVEQKKDIWGADTWLYRIAIT